MTPKRDILVTSGILLEKKFGAVSDPVPRRMASDMTVSIVNFDPTTSHATYIERFHRELCCSLIPTVGLLIVYAYGLVMK